MMIKIFKLITILILVLNFSGCVHPNNSSLIPSPSRQTYPPSATYQEPSPLSRSTTPYPEPNPIPGITPTLLQPSPTSNEEEGNNFQVTYPVSTTEKINCKVITSKQPPIAIVSIVGRYLKFDVIGKDTCLSDIALDKKLFPYTSYKLGPVIYSDPKSIFAILYADSRPTTILNFNPQTGVITSTRLPVKNNTLIIASVKGKLLLTQDNDNTVYILSNNLSIMSLKLSHPINKLIETKSRNVIALNRKPIEKDGETLVEFSLIDVISGSITQQQQKIPLLISDGSTPKSEGSYLSSIEGLSMDLKELYCLYYKGNTPNNLYLGVFDFGGSKEKMSTQDPSLVRIFGYAQYRDTLYVPGSPVYEEYSAGAYLINMSTLKSLLDIDNKNYSDLWFHMYYIYPYNDTYLLGTSKHVFLMSSTGKVLISYPLPQNWVDQRYQLMSYSE